MKRCWPYLFLGVAATALLCGCGDQRSEVSAAAPKPAAVKSPAPAAAAAPASMGEGVEGLMDGGLTVTGPLIVDHVVPLAGSQERQLDDRQLTSNLEATRAKTRSIEADLKNWESEMEVLKADYVRAQRLWNEKLIAEEQLQHAQYKVESDKWDILRVKEQLNTAKQDERSLELELEKTRIMAPFSGVVARRYTREGQSVAKGDRLFWVTAEGPLRIRFTLPEKYVGYLKKGQELPLFSPDLPAEKHVAKVIAISPVVDPSSATIEALAELVGGHGELRPGMSVAVRIASLR